MVLPTGGRKPGIPGQSRNELTDRILGAESNVLSLSLEQIVQDGRLGVLETFQQVFAYNTYDPADAAYGAVRSEDDPGASVKAANTAAIQAAADDAAANNGVLIIKGKYWINDEVQVRSHMNGSSGSLQVNDRDIPCVMLLGSRTSGTILERKHIIVPEIYQNDMPTGFQGTGVGLEVSNAKACHIFITHIRGFMENMWVSAYGQGNVGNTYYLGHLNNGKINLVLRPETGGWTNENLFLGGHFSHNIGEGSNISGVRHILLDDNDVYGPDNNLFVNPNIEGVVPEYHVEILNGRDNTIIQGRWETASGNPKVRYSGSRASHNVVDHGYNAHNIVYTSEDGATGNVHIDWRETKYHSASGVVTRYGSTGHMVRSDTPSRLIPTGSNNDPSLIILPVGSNESTGASAYGAQHGYSRTRYKETGDANPRIEVRHNLGQIWFGNGTDAVDVSLRQTATNTLGTGSGDNFYVGGGLEVDGALDHDGTTVGFYGTTPISKPSVTGATDSEKITSLITALSNLGLITDSTT